MLRQWGRWRGAAYVIVYNIDAYLYLILAYYFVVLWMLFYRWRPDVRVEMWVMSVTGAILAPFVDMVMLKDWWHPEMLTQGPVHAESLMFGFFSMGVTSVAAQVLLGQATYSVHRLYRPNMLHIVAGIIVSLYIMFGLCIQWGWNSAYTSLLANGFLALCVGVRRPDLLAGIGVSALLAGALAIPAYWMILVFLAPTWFYDAWYLHNLSGLWVARMPIEEILWYAGTGAAFGAAFKCLRGAVFVPYGGVSRWTMPRFGAMPGAVTQMVMVRD